MCYPFKECAFFNQVFELFMALPAIIGMPSLIISHFASHGALDTWLSHTLPGCLPSLL